MSVLEVSDTLCSSLCLNNLESLMDGPAVLRRLLGLPKNSSKTLLPDIILGWDSLREWRSLSTSGWWWRPFVISTVLSSFCSREISGRGRPSFLQHISAVHVQFLRPGYPSPPPSPSTSTIMLGMPSYKLMVFSSSYTFSGGWVSWLASWKGNGG